MINTNDPRQKVRAEHLQRDAYLYVRQSTLQQVFHNTESTQAAVRPQAARGSAGLAD